MSTLLPSRRAAWLPAAFLLALAAPAAAQTAELRGRVLEAGTDVPVANAEVAIPELRRFARTDAEGRFVIAGVPAGRQILRAMRLGYRALEQEVEVPSPDAAGVVVRLAPQAQAVAGVTATAPAVSRRMEDFERRRTSNRGSGRFLTRADLEKEENRQLADVVRQLGSAQIVRAPSGPGMYVATTRSMGPRALMRTPRPCFVQVFVDGNRIFGDDGNQAVQPPDLSQFLVTNIEAIEYYPVPSSTPPEFRTLTSECGTLVIWTRDGR